MTRSRARVTIAGERYTIGCAPGEEERIGALARELETMMERLAESLGDVGEHRRAVMAGLTALDRLSAAEAANAKLKARVEALERAREAAALAIDNDDEGLVARIEAVAGTVDRLAGLLNRDTIARSPVDLKAAPTRSVAIADTRPAQETAEKTAEEDEPGPHEEMPERGDEIAEAAAGADGGRLEIRPAGTGRH